MKRKQLLILIVICLIAGSIVLAYILGSEKENTAKNSSNQKLVAYQIQYEQYHKTITFTFEENQAKKAVILETYEDTLIKPAAIALVNNNEDYIGLKETENTFQYTYTEEAFQNYFNRTEQEIDEFMELLDYKKID